MESACRRHAYVPYPLLVPQHGTTTGQQAANQDVLFTATGVTVPTLEHPGQDLIDQVTWMSASIIAERLWGRFWPARTPLLAKHHRIVLDIATVWGWATARRYDIYQRQAVADDPTIDISVRNTELINNTAARLALKAQESAAAAQLEAAAALTAAISHGAAIGSQQRKRSNDFDSSPRTSPKRQSHTQPQAGDLETAVKCFRCGQAGHFTLACTNKKTIAGEDLAALAPTSVARSPNALLAKDGRVVCFRWAGTSSCSSGTRCANAHTCTVCGASAHGAGQCTAGAQRS